MVELRVFYDSWSGWAWTSGNEEGGFCVSAGILLHRLFPEDDDGGEGEHSLWLYGPNEAAPEGSLEFIRRTYEHDYADRVTYSCSNSYVCGRVEIDFCDDLTNLLGLLDFPDRFFVALPYQN